jgi:proline iminopeptidase
MTEYTIVIEDAGTNLAAYVIGRDGVVSTGKSIDEVIENMREAIPFHPQGVRLSGNELLEAAAHCQDNSGRLVSQHLHIGGLVTEQYYDRTDRPDAVAGGVRMIPITTPLGTFNVWTKRIGNNPALKVLLLHGGPGGTHDYFEAFDSFLPAARVEYYYYDQLGSGRSDNPADPRMWDLDRFIDEVEQVRIALELGPDNFVLLGHSWGGILAMEYALKHGDALKGLVISNMMSSAAGLQPLRERCFDAGDESRRSGRNPKDRSAKDFSNPRYMELLVRSYYVDHICV